MCSAKHVFGCACFWNTLLQNKTCYVKSGFMCAYSCVVDESTLPSLSIQEKNRIGAVLRDQRSIRNASKQIVYTSNEEPNDSEGSPYPQTASKSSQPLDSKASSQPVQHPKSSKPNRTRASLLYDLPISREGFTDEEFESVQQLRDAVADPANLKSKSPQDLFKSMGLTTSDRQFIESELRAIESKPLPSLKNVDTTPFERLEKIMLEDDGIYDSFEQWMKEVESVVGDKVNNPTSLTEEEIKNLPPAPRKLQEAMQYMLSGKK